MKVGWCSGNTVSFISAVALARHYARQGHQVEPFTYGPSRIREVFVPGDGPYVAVGGMDADKVDLLAKKGVHATIIAKLYGGRFDEYRPYSVGTVTVCPVPKLGEFKGLEYLMSLIHYANLNHLDTALFIHLHRMRKELGHTLMVTDAWFQAFDLLTSFEIVDNPSPADVERVVEHLKSRYGYGEKLAKTLDLVRSGRIAETRRYMVSVVDEIDPKKAALIYSKVSRKPICVVIGRSGDAVKVAVTSSLKTSVLRDALASALRGKIRGSTGRFSLILPGASRPHKIGETVVRVLARVA